MELLALLAAVGASLLVLASILPGTAVRERLATASVLLVAAVACWYVGSQFWGRIGDLLEQRRDYAATPDERAAVNGGLFLEQNTAFLEWAKELIGPRERFYLFPSGPDSDPNAYQWATYQLLPRLSVSSPDDADALVFYNVDPRAVPWNQREFQPPAQYDAAYSVALRKRRP